MYDMTRRLRRKPDVPAAPSPPAEHPTPRQAEPVTPRTRLTRERIAAAAITLADKEGFEAVSMRRIADELDVGTMSLYHYVKTRADLLALMDDALMGEHLLPAVKKKGGKALLQIALGTHAMLMRHPWVLMAMRGATPGPNALRHVEQCLEVLSETPLRPKEKLTLLAMVDDYVFGHALREAEAPREADQQLALDLLKSGEFPRLAETFRNGMIPNEARRLERALTAIIGSFLDD
jgi:AcrR family transcriptional regulator